MRTIAQSLLDLNQVKTDINNAIVNKGGTSSNSMPTFATSINNLPSGASLNVEYSTTAPTDTTKLWVETSITPTKTYIETKMPTTLNNSEMLIHIKSGKEYLTLATSNNLDIKLDVYDFYIGDINNAPVKVNTYVYKNWSWVKINTNEGLYIEYDGNVVSGELIDKTGNINSFVGSALTPNTNYFTSYSNKYDSDVNPNYNVRTLTPINMSTYWSIEQKVRIGYVQNSQNTFYSLFNINNGSNQVYFHVYVDNKSNTPSGVINFGGFFDGLYSTINPSNNEWATIVYVSDNDNHRFYLNGQLVQSWTTTPKSYENVYLTQGIFKYDWGYRSGASQTIDFSTFRYYTRALTDAEVLNLYNQSL